MVRLIVSESEARLIDEIQDIGYGEIFNVQHEQGDKQVEVLVFSEFKSMLVALRKVKLFRRITIHDSVPTIGEYTGINKHRFRKKIKF